MRMGWRMGKGRIKKGRVENGEEMRGWADEEG